jgi:membrane protein DedA with SNARE-associated domain/membrane-associated phospholipid phosphatase
MSGIETHLIPLIERLSSYEALIAFLAAFAETLIGLGWLLPGSTVLLIMGVLAGQGYLDFTTVLIAGILGAWLGDSANYALGRRYGTALLSKPPFHLPPSTLQKAHDFLDTRGAKAVFFSRFLPGLKEAVPFLAGSAEMARKKFMAWNLLGAIGWGFEFVGIGYLFSRSLSLAQLWLDRSAAVMAALILLLVILWMLKRFLQANLPLAMIVLHGTWDGFLHSPPIRRLIAQHPRFFAILSRRFDSRRFTGLPLTLLTLAFAYVLILFGGIVEDLLSRDPIVYLDQIVAHLMAQWRSPDLTAFFTWVTYLGRTPVVASAYLLSAAILLLYRRPRELGALTVSLAGSALFVTLGKLAFHRPRPEIALYLETSYSFPSGHAAVAVALYGFLGYLLMRHASTLRSKLNLLFVTTLLILLIGFSRIYLGEHYLSDVYAGFLLGTLWLIVGVALLKWMEYRGFLPEGEPSRAARPIVGSLVLLFLVAFSLYGSRFPYRLAVHPPASTLQLKDLRSYFSQEEHRLTRNLLGAPDRPVTLLIGTESDPVSRFVSSGWKPLKAARLHLAPIFWQGRSPLCRLRRKEGKTTYLLEIWRSRLRYRGHPLYAAVVDGITGWKWKLIPLYLPDPARARSFALRSLLQAYPQARSHLLRLAPESIRKHLNGQSYLDDGKAVWIETDKHQERTRP